NAAQPEAADREQLAVADDAVKRRGGARVDLPHRGLRSKTARVLRNGIRMRYVELTTDDPGAAVPNPSAADVEMLSAALANLFAPGVRELGLKVVEAREGEVVLALPVTPRHVHSGGVLCGQTMMAAADTAMVLAVMTRLGGFKPMTTVQLQTSFLRP